VSQVESPVPPLAHDREDERLIGAEGFRGAVGTLVHRVRAGELGALPVVLGLVVIAIVFQASNSLFLSSDNLTNLLLECVPTGVIALGIVCVLLLGQIDLSVGSVSGVTGALLAVLFVNKGLPAVLAIAISVLAGTAIGFLYAQIFNRLGVPSFVITLAGLLAFVGAQLWLLGSQGAINLPFDSALVKFAQLDFVPVWASYLLVLLAAGGIFVTGFLRARRRRNASLSGNSLSLLVVRSLALLVVGVLAVFYLNTGQGRGVGWMFVFFVVLVIVMHYVFTRTKFGRSMFAVGGNVEAARRAGINIRRVYAIAFMLSSTFAAVGGILAASRLAAVNQQSGGADVNLNAIAAAVIGGTSLFGGRGSAVSALLGIVVIQAISNGLTLLNLNSSYRYMITGGVLLLAVAVDSVARRSRASSGTA
jgi:simple sugar transport system permease protein/D-xylose transport system permease protein